MKNNYKVVFLYTNQSFNFNVVLLCAPISPASVTLLLTVTFVLLMASLSEVEDFLRDFKYKSDRHGIVLLTNRAKNQQLLANLGLTATDAVRIVLELQATDYSSGPVEDVVYKGPPMWIFGCEVEGIELYVKVTLGNPGLQTICISFHKAEYPMAYPLKT